MFATGAAATTTVSLWLYVAVFIHESGVPNAWALFTIIGAPLAYWIAWMAPSSRLIRGFAIVLFAAAIYQVVSGLVIMLYFPGLVGLLAGTPRLPPVSARQ